MSFTQQMKEDWCFVFGSERMEDAYIAGVTCQNCSDRAQIWIKKGTLKSAIVPVVCQRCGCKEMK